MVVTGPKLRAAKRTNDKSQSEVLDRAVAEMANIDEPWHSVAREPQGGCYCKGKMILQVVDMLTYPRPVRKFEARERK